MRRLRRALRAAFPGLGVVALALAGCGDSAAPPAAPAAPAFAGTKVVVVAVGEPALIALVKSQRGEWEASRSASALLREGAVEPGATGDAHLLLFPGERLGDLVDAGALAPIPEAALLPPLKANGEGEEAGSASAEEADPLQFADVMPAFRDQASRWGTERFALPFGGSALVLAYNRAAFESESAREAARAAGLTLQPPKTWGQLDALVKLLHGRDWNGDGAPDAGIAVPFGADPEGVGDAVFLARAAGLGQHRDHYSLLFDSDTMAPRVASPPFVEALGGLAGWLKGAPAGAAGFDAAQAREAFRKGGVAFLIDRAERASGWSGGGAKLIGVAPLPGSERVYEPSRRAWEASPASAPNRVSYLPVGGGWLVGVAAKATGAEREAALDLAKYLVNPETSNRTRSDRAFPMLPVRGSQVGQGLPDPRSAPGVDTRAWSDALTAALVVARVVPGLRVPQAPGYLADLSRGRVAALSGRASVESALKGVEDAWSARTQKLGVERQLWHYRRSLNSLVTTPKPPPAAGR